MGNHENIRKYIKNRKIEKYIKKKSKLIKKRRG